jgi:hypothetical protein
LPFTFSHAAAAAPFWPLVRRRILPLSALVIGTMTPDFEFVRALQSEWGAGHTATGLLTFCLPVGLAMTALWVFVLRDPVRDLLTLPFEQLRTDARWWQGAVLAVLIGAITHQLWDGVTHGAVWATHIIPNLDQALTILGFRIPVFNMLQHLSTLLGGLVVLPWLVRQVRASGDPPALLRPWRLAAVAGILALSAALAAWNAPKSFTPGDFWLLQGQISETVVGALVGLLIALTGFALTWRVAASRQLQQ